VINVRCGRWLDWHLSGQSEDSFVMSALAAFGVYMKIIPLWARRRFDGEMWLCAPAEMMNVGCSVPTPECVCTS